MNKNNTTATIFVGSLKKNYEESNTYKVSLLVKKEFANYNIKTNLVYLRDIKIAPGVEFDTGEKWDEFGKIYKLMDKTDIVLLGTPIWWGIHSSLCQAFMERIGAYDDLAIKTGLSPLYNKVFGMIITASNDGFQHIHGIFNAFATSLGLTCPPENHIYWGTVLNYTKDKNDPSSNEETVNMVKNCCRNLYLWSKVVKQLKLGTIAQKIKPGRVGVLSTDQLYKSY